MAQAARKATTQNSAAPKGEVLAFHANDEFNKVCKRESARSRTARMAQEFNGKSLAEFKAAWEAAADKGEIHHDASKFTTGTSKTGKHRQEFGGWLGWLKRTGMVTTK